MKLKLTWVYYLFLTSLFVVKGQDRSFIKTYQPVSGIPSIKISKIAKDSLGYLWLGSNVGLHRFDGKELTTFKHNPNDSTSIASGQIADIQVHPDGDVYFTILFKGLYRYNIETSKIETLTTFNAFKNAQGYQFFIFFHGSRILINHRYVGLFEWKEDQGLIPLAKNLDITKILSFPGEKDNLLLLGDQVYQLDLSSLELSVVSKIPFEDAAWLNASEMVYVSKFENTLEALHIDEGKTRLIGKGTEKNTYFIMLEVTRDKIWIGSNNGLWAYDKESQKLYKESQSINLSGQALPLEVYELFSEGSELWFTQGANLNLITPDNQLFNFIVGSESHDYIKGIELNDEEILFPTYVSNEFHIYNKITGWLDTSNSRIRGVRQDYLFDFVKVENKAYLFYVDGVAVMDLSTLQIRDLSFGNYDEYFYVNHKKQAYRDENNVIWLSDLSLPIVWRYDPKSGDIDSIHYQRPEDDYITSFIWEDNRICLGAREGIRFLDFHSKNEVVYPFDKSRLNFSYLEGILEHDNELWILTNGEIYRTHIQNDSIQVIKKYDELNLGQSDNKSILLSPAGQITVLTAGGVKVYDETHDRFQFYGADEGFVGIQRTPRIQRIGEQMFILSNGIKEFKYDQVNLKKEQPVAFLTSFTAGGKEISFDENPVLNHTMNDIQISFNSIDLSKPFAVEFRYRLNKSDEWIITDYKNTTLNFLDLKSGDYEFQLEAKHWFTDWSETATFSYTIKPPYWRTWWFISMIVIGSMVVAGLIFQRRVAELKRISNLQTRMIDLENKALRAQMNPHFIFNSLNSIKSFIIENEREEAADYLTDFSDLIRIILSNSREQLITVSREMDALRLYMAIENKRLEDKFTYIIENPDHLNLDSILIPPLSLQPFIENAIWHGFIHKKEKGQLVICLKLVNENLNISITDDGVGRAKSQEIELKHKRKRSYGILITRERLQHSSDYEGQVDNVEIIDLYDSEGNACGTKVIVSLPYKRTQKANLPI